MKTTHIKELTADAFAPYGGFTNMINPDTPKIGDAPIEFFRDMIQLDLGTSTTASFSVCRVEKRPLVVDTSEYHNDCGEGILPLDSDALIHVAPATPDDINSDDVEVFRVPKGTMVVLRPGVWHHAPYAYGSDAANVLIILPERTYKKDCIVQEIPKKEQVEAKA